MNNVHERRSGTWLSSAPDATADDQPGARRCINNSSFLKVIPMRLSVFLALVVATFVATCGSLTSAENVAHLRGVEHENNVKTSRELKVDEWWLPDSLEEERAGGTSFFSKLASKVAQIRSGGVKQTKTLSDAQIKSITKEVATNVKKNPKMLPKVKTGLKILFGATLATTIFIGIPLAASGVFSK